MAMAYVVTNDLEGHVGLHKVLYAGMAQRVRARPRYLDADISHASSDHGRNGPVVHGDIRRPCREKDLAVRDITAPDFQVGNHSIAHCG